MVRQIALDYGRQQEPEFAVLRGAKDPDQIRLVGAIGSERFPLPGGNCDGSEADWRRIIKDGRKRGQLDRISSAFRIVPACLRRSANTFVLR